MRSAYADRPAILMGHTVSLHSQVPEIAQNIRAVRVKPHHAGNQALRMPHSQAYTHNLRLYCCSPPRQPTANEATSPAPVSVVADDMPDSCNVPTARTGQA